MRIVTILFTDIEGSSRLWDSDAQRMREALAAHDRLVCQAVEASDGRVVKSTGDGIYAVFDDPVDAVHAALALQLDLKEPAATNGLPLRVRCGIHHGAADLRDGDYFGSEISRAARIMSAGHGGQVLLSESAARLVRGRLGEALSLQELGSFRLRNLTSPERIYQLRHPSLRSEFPALRAVGSTPHNLPRVLSSFIGRGRELGEAGQLLAQSRLVTVVGVGGIGKTRLALELAAGRLSEFRDGVWFVDLAPLHDAALVPSAVAQTLGVLDYAGRSAIEASLEYLRDRSTLLVFDNCEHVVEVCAVVVNALLRGSDRLKVLATSRQPLHVPGEQSYPLPALGLPDPDACGAPAALLSSEATRLFVQRAHEVLPHFAVSPDAAPVIATICQQLDGIPLAIELAASRLRTLPLRDVGGRIHDRLGLLTAGDRTQLARQKTLRSLIDWSFDLLTEPERRLFCRLSVFSGGWTLETGEAIGVCPAIRREQVLDLLAGLVDKSLVSLNVETGRYEFLETLREYAHERLVATGDERAARDQHLGEFLDLAERAADELTSFEQARWMERLDREYQNLMQAHTWCGRDEQRAHLGLRLVSALRPFFIQRGHITVGYRLCTEAIARAGAQEDSSARCRALFAAAEMSFYVGELMQAKRHAEAGLASARTLNDAVEVAEGQRLLGHAALAMEGTARAREHFESALALTDATAHTALRARVLRGLAVTCQADGDVERAKHLLEASVALCRQHGDLSGAAVGLADLARVDVQQGSAATAAARLREALAIADQVGSKRAGVCVLECLTQYAASRGDALIAARFNGATDALSRKLAIPRYADAVRAATGCTDHSNEPVGLEPHAEAELAGRGLNYFEALHEAREWLDDICAAPARGHHSTPLQC